MAKPARTTGICRDRELGLDLTQHTRTPQSRGAGRVNLQSGPPLALHPDVCVFPFPLGKGRAFSRFRWGKAVTFSYLAAANVAECIAHFQIQSNPKRKRHPAQSPTQAAAFR
jgi:hypothetical protein